MNRVFIFLLCSILLSVVQLEARASEDPNKITFLDGKAVLGLSGGSDFPCIGIQYKDHNARRGLGTYLEIKRRDDKSYLMKYNYKIKTYNSVEKAVEVYLKDLFKRFYREDKKYGKKVWKSFVEEDGLKQFLEITKDFMDDEFFDSPFNERYG